ncbi:MAG: discoidin domain-containing protein [Gloeotrichia echinulata HAB0833]
MSKQIKDFEEITTLEDGDWLLVQPAQGGIYRKITKANLLAGLSGGNTSSVQCNFVSVGDANGIVSWIGTNGKTTAFSDPTSKITVSSSSVLGDLAFTRAFQRVPSLAHSNNGGNQWVQVDFLGRKVSLTHYTIQGRNDDNYHHLRNWVLQGSNDGVNFDVLDTRTNNSSINRSSWFLGVLGTSSNYYRYIRLTQTGANSEGDSYLTMGQMEFYGGLK